MCFFIYEISMSVSYLPQHRFKGSTDTHPMNGCLSFIYSPFFVHVRDRLFRFAFEGFRLGVGFLLLLL